MKQVGFDDCITCQSCVNAFHYITLKNIKLFDFGNVIQLGELSHFGEGNSNSQYILKLSNDRNINVVRFAQI